MSWLSRLKNALHSRRLDDDLSEELADHLARRAAALAQKGLGVEEAQQQARIRFGNATRLREQSREMHVWTTVESALQDARYAWRGMRKSPAFAATAVLSLALAIGANTAIYSILDAAILRPLPVSRPDQLFMLSYPDIYDPGTTQGAERDSFSYPEYLQFASVLKPVARLEIFSSPNRVEARMLSSETAVEKINRAYVSGEAFDMLGVHPVIGRLFSAEQDRIPQDEPVAVLSYEYWQRRFNRNPAVLGRRIVIEGKSYDVTGVAQKGFFGVEPGKFVDVWVPASLYEQRALTDAGWHWFQIMGRYPPGVSALQVQTLLQPSFHEFQVQWTKRMPTMPAAIKAQFLKSEIHAHSASNGVSGFRKDFSEPLWIVFGVAAGILLIACMNVASLLLARATARAMEMAMRVSLGAARVRLIRQMLTESLLLSFMAGALGWLAARALAPFLINLLSQKNDPVQFVLAIDTRVLLFCIGVSTLSAVIFGLIPAWQSSGAQPINSLRGSTGQATKLRLGKLFVSIQVACAFCLVTVGAAFLFSLGNLLHVNPGFDARNVAVLNVTTASRASDDMVAWNEGHPEEQARARNLIFQLQRQIASQPSVQGAAIAWWPIFVDAGWFQQIVVPGRGPSEREEIIYRISPGYFSALRIPLISGRDFVAPDSIARTPAPAIVNEAFARKYFGSVDVIGREFSYLSHRSPQRQMIVGVVADTHYYALRGGVDPMVYLPIEGANLFTLYVRSSLPFGQVVHVVDREAHAIGGGMRIGDVTTLKTIVGNTLLREKLLADIGGAFAFFGLLLAAIGLFGLLSYSVGRRTKELGIRTALGARRVEIVLLVIKDVAALTGGGVLIGLASALAVMALFRSLLFGIKTVDPVVATTAVALFLLTGLIAAAFPARRAASIDPMLALREE